MSYSIDPRPPTPPQPSSEMSQIARAIEMMAMNQNQQAMMNKLDATGATTSSCSSQPQEQMSLIDFLRHNPSMFSGNSTPDQADKWMRELEKIFRATSCSEDKKLIFATYLLSGEAKFWWMGAQKMMEARAELSPSPGRTS